LSKNNTNPIETRVLNMLINYCAYFRIYQITWLTELISWKTKGKYKINKALEDLSILQELEKQYCKETYVNDKHDVLWINELPNNIISNYKLTVCKLNSMGGSI
jgi:hypothetical protein